MTSCALLELEKYERCLYILLSTSLCHVIVVSFKSIQSAATNTEHSDSELGDVMRDLQRKLKREMEQSGADAKRAQKDRDKVKD